MTRLRLRSLRTWSLIAAAVIMQTPAMLAINNGVSPRHTHADNEIAHIQADGTTVTLNVIVRVESRGDLGSVLAALRTQGFNVGRPSPLTNSLPVTIPSSALAWLEAL